jgi:hypothetical protein
VAQPQGGLIATILTEQTFNPQTGLMEQTINVLNATNITVAAVRVVLSNYNHYVYNAVGTNNGSPYVEYPASLGPGTNVNLLLEYFIPTRTPVDAPVLGALGVPAINRNASSNAPPNATIKRTTDFRILVEFASEPGATYTIVYADNPGFSNAQTAQPPVTAVATRTQWIDSGPPKTISVPADENSRFYRVTKGQ